MLPTIADLAAAIDRDPHPEHRAVLELLAFYRLRIEIQKWQLARLRALECRLTLDSRPPGGDDDQRDAAAA